MDLCRRISQEIPANIPVEILSNLDIAPCVIFQALDIDAFARMNGPVWTRKRFQIQNTTPVAKKKTVERHVTLQLVR